MKLCLLTLVFSSNCHLNDLFYNRPELLSLVQIHHAQCLILESAAENSSDKELEPQELEEILSKLKESVQSDIRQAAVWNTLGFWEFGIICKMFPLNYAGTSASEGASADQVVAVNVAKECLLAAVKADPKSGHIWTNLANAFSLCGDHRSSSMCLEKVFMTHC
ncbi:hypothetical protein K1719_000353 [Acacia pycnantha]|nr:hypothetical protein K1719_000353 [Acacia pycnantha]